MRGFNSCMVFAVNCDPFASHDTRSQPQPETEHVTDERMQGNGAVRLVSMEEDRYGSNRTVGQHRCRKDIGPPREISHDLKANCRGLVKSPGRVAESPGSIRDSALGQVVWSEFNSDPITTQDSDVMLSHFSRNMGNDDMLVVEFYAKLRVGEVFQHRPLHFYMFFFGHGPRAALHQNNNQPIISKCT